MRSCRRNAVDQAGVDPNMLALMNMGITPASGIDALSSQKQYIRHTLNKSNQHYKKLVDFDPFWDFDRYINFW